MKVSIITTCYNREKTIRDAIESVLRQSYVDIEYIVVDGVSSDGSLSIIKEYQSQIATIISEHDRGMYEAVNKGLRVATGDVIGLLHSDDFLFSNDTISRMVECFNQTESDLVYGNGLFINANNTNQIVRNWISGNYTKSKIGRGWLPLHPTVYIKKTYLDKIGEYDENLRISSDSDFLIRCLYTTTGKISYLNEYIVRMRMGGLSTGFSHQIQKWEEDLQIYRKYGFNPYWTLMLKILSKIPQFWAK